jgi:hypothetical protein
MRPSRWAMDYDRACAMQAWVLATRTEDGGVDCEKLASSVRFRDGSVKKTVKKCLAPVFQSSFSPNALTFSMSTSMPSPGPSGSRT